MTAAPARRTETILDGWLRGGVLAEPENEAEAWAVLDRARDERLHGLLAEAVLAAAGWPSRVADALALEQRALLARGLRQLDVAARALRTLHEADVRALPFKGAALAETAYRSVAHRPMHDLDLLVIDAWPRAVAVLEAAGWQAEERESHAWSFADPLAGGRLELHRSVTTSAEVFDVDLEGLWQRRRSGLGLVSPVPCPVDHVLLLSLHAAFQHGLALPALQLLDVRRLTDDETLDADLLGDRARAWRAAGALAVTLRAAEARVGLGAFDRCVAARLMGTTRAGSASPPSRTRSLAAWRWTLARGRRARLLRGTLAPPGLPAARVPARVARLAFRAASGLLRSAAASALRRGASAGTDAERPPGEAMLVTGECMRPALEAGDRVWVATGRPAARLGDVALVAGPQGPRLHRLVWGPPLPGAAGRWRTKGDRSPDLDPWWIGPESILGIVVASQGRGPGGRSLLRALASMLGALRFRLKAGRA